MPGDSRQGADYRSNLHVPGMDAVPDTEVQESVVPGDPCNRADDRSFSYVRQRQVTPRHAHTPRATHTLTKRPSALQTTYLVSTH